MNGQRAETDGREDHFVTVDGLEVHYSEWGDETDDPVLCIHGFARTGRDFDELATSLANDYDYRVLCPDVPGRGLSEWSRMPTEDYAEEGLASRLALFCDALELNQIRWVGTSMGGALGILLAGGALRERISRFVLNDIGPGPVDGGTKRDGMERIENYLRDPPQSRTLGELERQFRAIYEENKPALDVRRLTLTSTRRTDEGDWTVHYDPNIVDVRFSDYAPRDSWDKWDAVTADTLLLRGEDSDILSTATVDEMLKRQPGCKFVELPGVGHAPSLATDEQIETVADFLAR